jgi:SAM-dependent methyltransferase
VKIIATLKLEQGKNMNETSKSYGLRKKLGHFENYLRGRGIDIGAGNDLLKVEYGVVDPFDMQHGDANYIDSIQDDTYDFSYSSHCLEHMFSVRTSLFNWTRVLKPGGFLYTVVPDYELYEKCMWPPRFNLDHKQTFSMKLKRETIGRLNHWHIHEDIVPLLGKLGLDLVEAGLQDQGYDYSWPTSVDQTAASNALCQIYFVFQKRR